MRPDYLRQAGLVAGAVVAGAAAWAGHVLLLPLATAFPCLWSRAQGRGEAILIAAGYFLAASRGLPQGVAHFYAADLWPGLLLWLLASTGFVAVHVLFWTKSPLPRPFCYLLIAVLTALPPFGVTGWAHPVTAAGILFPEGRWWGLTLTMTGLMGLTTRLWPWVTIAFSGLWLISAATWIDPAPPTGWHGVDLALGASLGRDASLQRHHVLTDLVSQPRVTAPVQGRSYLVLPESALGFWTPAVEAVWVAALRQSEAHVIAGAAIVDGSGYDNVLVSISGVGGHVLYRQRMPVPGAMWAPWQSLMGASGGAHADFFRNPVVIVDNRRIALLICYEQLLIWPVLHSMWHDPELLVAVANGWWTADTRILAVQTSSTMAWARLFGKPLVLSFNR